MSKRGKRRRSELQSEPEPGSAARWGIPILLIAVTLVAMFPLCGFDFTTWDDTTNIANNPLLNPPTLANLWTCWTKPQLAIYIPITYTVWAFIALLARTDSPDASGIWLNPYLFHTANLLVHLIAVLMVYAMLKRIVGKPWPAAVGAMVFAVHPLQVETVAWIAGMKDLLCGMLTIAALWQLVVYAQTEHRRRRVHYALATIAYAVALLSKPSAMAVPLLALIVARFICHLPWRRVAITIGPWFMMAIPIGIVAKLAQPVSIAYEGGKTWLRPLIATDALAFYAYKVLLPLRLAVQYNHYPQVVIEHRWLYWTWIVPVSLAVVALLFRKRLPWLWIGLAIIPGATLPVLGLVPFQFERLSVVADHYMYVAMLGVALIAAHAIMLLPRRPAVIGSVVVIAAMAIWSNVQTWNWRDTESLFRHELVVNPQSFAAYNSLAAWAVMHHHPEQAIDDARRAVELKPDFAEGWGTLGAAYSGENRPADAATAFKRAYELSSEPQNAAIAASHLGAALASTGQPGEAERYLRRASELDPLLDEAHLNLAVLFANQRRIVEAISEAETAARLGPDNPQNHLTLAILLDQRGDRTRAVEEYQRTLALSPDSPIAKRGLATPLNSPAGRR